MLAERFPGHVPAPLALEPERGWFLLPGVRGASAGAPLDVRCEVLTRFAGLQRRAADQAAS